MLYVRPIVDPDLSLLDTWLHKPYILKWYENPNAWLDEVRQRNGRYAFIHHYIVMDGDQPIGFCQYYDCIDAGEDWYSVSVRGTTYSIDYLIGEETRLQKGHGKRIIQLLIDTIRTHTQAKEVIVQPDEENLLSCKTLLSCGFMYDAAAGYYHLAL